MEVDQENTANVQNGSAVKEPAEIPVIFSVQFLNIL
jgi:hypothetical protein